MRRIVVVGAGLAGFRAACAVREAGFAGELVVVGDEVHRPYDRPPLSKQLLAGTFDEAQCFFESDGLDADWRLGRRAEALDLAGAAVTLAGGETVGYDGLVIATGRRARPWRGAAPTGGVHTLRTMEDTAAFKAAAVPGARVVVVGAGFIGCEVAATLRAQQVDVTVVDVASHPMPVLGVEAGGFAAEIHQAHGVALRLGRGVASLDGVERIESVTLTDGEVLPADVVLVAMGSVANTEWLQGSGVTLAAGAVVCAADCAVVDSRGEPLPNVVAVGDVAAWPHPAGDGPVCIEHWTNARDMAATGVANLLSPGSRAPLASVPSFWSDQYNVKIKSAGYLRAADRFTVVSKNVERSALVVEAHRGDELVGAIAFNMNRTMIRYQRELAAAAVPA